MTKEHLTTARNSSPIQGRKESAQRELARKLHFEDRVDCATILFRVFGIRTKDMEDRECGPDYWERRDGRASEADRINAIRAARMQWLNEALKDETE